MDECGVCGGDAVGEGLVEGARLWLCEDCLRYADKVFAKQQAARQQAVLPKKKELVLVEGFGRLIQKAREAKNLSRRQFAEKVLIRENELTSFEEEKLKPVEDVAKKIGFALGIKILEEETGLEAIARQSRSSQGEGFSLGDMVRIKKR